LRLKFACGSPETAEVIDYKLHEIFSLWLNARVGLARRVGFVITLDSRLGNGEIDINENEFLKINKEYKNAVRVNGSGRFRLGLRMSPDDFLHTEERFQTAT
jgi:hypothetical protein